MKTRTLRHLTKASLFAMGIWLGNGATVALAADITVYKSPTCGCCAGWVDHMKENGFSVAVKEREDLSPIKSHYGVPENLESCHTAEVEGYTIEGHVPASDVLRLLAERPKARGLAVPGMPIGSPGMEMGNEKEPYPVVIFGEDGQFIYARH
ncbi:MAG: DUF411 domain-containing protein [Rhodospirillaceae bacterium]|nr:DUF411 domain-containing protein [Rhodospirillaceae bacterium]MBL6931976.1 DUF411 domain-containing protein [Rhodospirillales bacterium]